MKKFYPSFDSPIFTKENIYKSVYLSGKYSDEKLRKLLSDLYKLAEKFLVISNIESNKLEYPKLLLEELHIKRLDNIYISKYKETYEYLKNTGQHYQMFLHEHQLKWLNVSFMLSRADQFSLPSEIFERSEQLIFYFLSDLFITLNDIEMTNINYNYSHTSNLPQKFIDNFDIEKFYESIEKSSIRNKEVFSLYYHTYLMNKYSDDEKYFFRLKDLLYANIDKLNDPGKLNFIVLLLNYCNVKLKKVRNSKLEKVSFELYELHIKHGLFKSEDNYFRTDMFINIFRKSLLYKSIEESVIFLEENISLIHHEHQKNLVWLCKALILFDTGKFREALTLTSKINSNLIIIKTQLRKLLMKISYELNEFDENKDDVNNYRTFVINSKSISEINQNLLLGFIKTFNDLINLKNNKGDDYLIGQIKKDVDKMNDLSDRDWFTKKLMDKI
ncbi:MAG: hypothetical protein SGI89_04190 [bacterium]|nr:hypothetical protein [bacterium]